MARTHGRSGPAPKYGKRRDYHILLSVEVQPGEAMSLADAFEQVAKQHGGVIAYTTKIIEAIPEIKALLERKA